jgi:zinc protease
MKTVCKVLALLLASVLMACGQDQVPELRIDSAPYCHAGGLPCVNAETETYDFGGIHIIHKKTNGEPLVALRILFDQGNASGKQMWAESLALGMLSSEGPSDLGVLAWANALDRLRASVFAYSASDYSIISADVLKANWDPLWELLAHAIRMPYHQDSALAWERKFWLRELKTEPVDPASAAAITARSAVFEHHRYERLTQTQADLRKITNADIQMAWTGLRTHARMWIVVVGDVEWPDLRVKLWKAFGNLPERSEPDFGAAPREDLGMIDNQATVLDYPDFPIWHIETRVLGPKVTDGDYGPLLLGMGVLSDRLFIEVREKRGLAYEIGASLSSLRQTAGSLSLTTTAPDEALPVVQATISELLEDPAGENELEAVRQRTRTGMLAAVETPGGLADTLGDWQMKTGNHLNLDRFVRDLDAVTPAQVRHALRRYLHSASIAAAGSGSTLDEAQLRAIVPEQSPDATP